MKPPKRARLPPCRNCWQSARTLALARAGASASAGSAGAPAAYPSSLALRACARRHTQCPGTGAGARSGPHCGRRQRLEHALARCEVVLMRLLEVIGNALRCGAGAALTDETNAP